MISSDLTQAPVSRLGNFGTACCHTVRQSPLQGMAGVSQHGLLFLNAVVAVSDMGKQGHGDLAPPGWEAAEGLAVPCLPWHMALQGISGYLISYGINQP